MNLDKKRIPASSAWRHVAIGLWLLSAQAWAGTLDIVDRPLATGVGLSVKPNLLFILDDSGSMASDYTPDWVNTSICQSSMSSYGSTHDCESGFSSNRADPPYLSGEFNKQYYNPAIRYRPPKSYNGTEWGNATPTAAISGDIFRGSTTALNLTTSYPDAYWCKDSGDTAPGPNCHNNEGTHYGYGYPNNVWNVRKNINGRPFYYVLNGSPTWCSDVNLTVCQSTRTPTYRYPRFSDVVTAIEGSPGTPEILGSRAKLTITVSDSSSSKSIQTVKCGYNSTGATVFSGTYTPSNSSDSTLASWLADKLEDCSNPAAGDWVVTYPSASGNNNEIDISWPVTGTSGNGQRFYIWIDTNSNSAFTVRIGSSNIDSNSMPSSLPGFALSGGQDYQAATGATADVITFPGSGVQFSKVVIDPAVTEYARGTDRTDCVADTTEPYTCSYAEELQNFANWFQYYRTRMLMMKTSVSRVFADVTDTAPGSGFRVGFDRISRDTNDLEVEIGDFLTAAGGKKQDFYDALFDASPSSWTPLRGALSKAGRVFAGTIGTDPVQLSCQQNFTFLSTDGYWNTNAETSTYGPFKQDGSSVGDQDSGTQPAMAAGISLEVTDADYGYQITQIKCGDDSATATTINDTYTITGSSGSSRRSNTANWIASKLTQCHSPAAGAWQIGRVGQQISISWPTAGVGGNGQPFYIYIKVNSTSNVEARLGGTTVVTTSATSPALFSGTLSGGAEEQLAPPRPYYDGLAKSNTLADVAWYYWANDLRSGLVNDVPMSARDTANWQHMTTFTMGLGIDGTLSYARDYEGGGSEDYNAILNNSANWPDPINNTQDERIDDLWHAAVNGHGLYFSASRPDEVVEQISSAIDEINKITGAASAAATSNLEPVAGDNFAYVASYRTQQWDGDLQARSVNIGTAANNYQDATGEISTEPLWSAAYQLGKQASRTLYTFNAGAAGSDKKVAITWGGLTSAEQAAFAVSQLYQCDPTTMCPGATSNNLFDYLMGGVDATTNHSYRDRDAMQDPSLEPSDAENTPVDNRLGDIVNSQPIFMGRPNLAYEDSNYSYFKTSSPAATRYKSVYVGANDGFLHSFSANTGTASESADIAGGVERWAYMPRAQLTNLYKIASADYAHQYYQDGTIAVTDAFDSSLADPGADAYRGWRTVLVSGMNKGGKYYFALDVTDPASPKALWELTDSSMGYSYGNPIITKLPSGATDSGGNDVDGRWVVLLTSGYNNSGGKGIVYVVDLFSGSELFRMETTTGSTADPVGLAKINAWSDDPAKDNTATYVYGGDLNGDLWRFDLATKSVLKVAAVGAPITVKPELGEIISDGIQYRVIFFGTGKFLEESDKSDDSQQTFYAVKDTGSTQTNLRTGGLYVGQTLMEIDDGNHRTTTTNEVDWSIKNGWFIDLPRTAGSPSERVVVDPKLAVGTIIFASNIPDAGTENSCTAGGSSWLNYVDMRTGSFILNAQDNSGQYASTRLPNALVVGINVIKLPSGKIVALVTTSDNKHMTIEVPFVPGGTAKRVSWRELMTD